jgi:glutamyl-tRNA(Gln) amidotransferase subunit D
MKNIVDFFLSKKKLSVGDYIEIELIDGTKYRGIIMPKHGFSDPDILVIKLDNGYNVGFSVESVVDARKIEFKPVSEGISVEKEVVKREGLPHVLIMAVGGTILSKVDYTTGAVRSAVTAEELLSILPEVAGIAEIETNIIMNKYSEHLTPRDWSKIAKEVYNAINKGVYDGIVILHGTDTLGYTAAALSFAVQQLPIPIVLVGSQRSSDRPSSDAALNLISAIRVAGYSDIAEVVVAMHNDTSDNYIAVHQGTRVRKNHTSRRDAFQSIDVTPYMIVDERGGFRILREGYRRRNMERKPVLYGKFSDDVSLLKFYPGLQKNILLYLYREGIKAIILEGTGLGHVGEGIMDTLKYIIDKGVHVFMTSQCIWGRVNMNVYDTGRLLKKMGVISLENVISETAYVKACWILGNFGEKDLDTLMTTNIVGEAVPRSPIEDLRRGFSYE